MQRVGGRYELLHELGEGAFGKVWKAWDPVLGTTVAVKEVFLSGLSESEHAQRLARAEREARNAAKLRDHPNVATVHDAVLEDGKPWIVMDFVDGRSLAQVVAEDGPLPTENVARIARGLLAALRAAHGLEIVHRDVKPQNVLLGADGRVLLTDFGIAVHSADTAMTGSSGLIGTLEYMAPERFNGQDSGPAADLYSLGVTLFQAAEGFSPFHRETPTETLTAVVLGTAPEPLRAGPLAPLISRLMDKDPAHRPTAEQALAVLDGVLMPNSSAPTADARLVPPPPPVNTPPLPARTPPRAVHRRKPALIAGAVVLALAVGIGTAIALTSGDSDGDSSTNASSPGGSSTAASLDNGARGPSAGSKGKPDWCLEADGEGRCSVAQVAGCQHNRDISENVSQVGLILQNRATGDIRALLQAAIDWTTQDLNTPHTPPEVQQELTKHKEQLPKALDGYAADGTASRDLSGLPIDFQLTNKACLQASMDSWR